MANGRDRCLPIERELRSARLQSFLVGLVIGAALVYGLVWLGVIG